MANIVAAADIGGSHITVGLIDLDNKQIIEESVVRLKVDSKAERERILGAWVEAFEILSAKTAQKIEKIAFAMPGPFDYENGISLIQGVDKYESLYGENIRNYFAEHFAIAPHHVVFRNDAEAFLHGEVTMGDYGFDERVLGFTLGTGFGSAFSTAGYTLDLVIGLSPFKDSIVDNYLSTRWFKKRSLAVLGEALDVKELVTRADDGDRKVLMIFDEFAQNFFGVVAPKVIEHQADCLVLGGNISKAYLHFLPKIYQLFFNENLKVNIKLGKLGEFAAMAGSAVAFQTNPSLS